MTLISSILRTSWQGILFILRSPNTIWNILMDNIRAGNERTAFILTYGAKYQPIAGYLRINGFLPDRQAIALFDMAMSLPDNPIVVEIGSWQGKSSIVLAKGMQYKINPRLFCIDPFDASGDTESETQAYRPYLRRITKHFWQRSKHPLLERFIYNLRRNHVDGIVSILKGYSYDHSRLFSERIDLLFIDGNHEYTSVKRDFEEWSVKLKNGGILVLHDVDFDPWKGPTGHEDKTGPGRVAQEYIINSHEWSIPSMVENMLIAIKS